MAMFRVNRRDFINSAALAGLAAGAVKLSEGEAFAQAAQTGRAEPDVAWLDGAPPASHAGQTWGMPWPRGAVPGGASFRAVGADGRETPLQTWTTAWWPDGSIKWTGHAIPGGETPPASLRVEQGAPMQPSAPLSVTETANAIEIRSGDLVWRVGKKGAALIQSATRGGRETLKEVRLLASAQAGPDGDNGERPALTQYTGEIATAVVEQRGPVRAVVRIEGKHRAGSRQWLPFTLRLYFHAGSPAVRIVHSFIFDGDETQDFIRGLGLTGAVPMSSELHDRHVRFAGPDGGLWGEAVRPLTGLRRQPPAPYREAQVAGKATPPVAELPANIRDLLKYVAAWGDFTLSQPNADGFSITKRTTPGQGCIDVDPAGRAPGFGYVGSPVGGVAFGMKDFWQRPPVRLDIRDAATDLASFTVWHHSPDAPAMDLRMYHDGMGMNDHVTENKGLEITYEDYEKGWGTPHGIARTTEFMLWALPATPARADLVVMANEVARQPRLQASVARVHTASVFGPWDLANRSTPQRKAIEDRNDATLEYYIGQVDQRRWYGFWSYGDVMHAFDSDRNVWKYDIGGFAWDNSELSTDLWLWYSYLHTGRADVFRFAEAMTRHTGEVDVHHIGPFKGFGTRHGVQHWSDSSKQPRVSTAVYRRIYYYLTTDERVGDLMHQLIDSEYTLQTVDIGRKVLDRAEGSLPPGGTSAVASGRALPKGQVFVQFGTSWGSFVAAWFTEWERTRDVRWRDRIVAGMETIAAMPLGWFTGGSAFELATGRFVNPPKAVSVSHLNGVFGVFEIHAELLELLDVPAYREAWLRYCELYNVSAEDFEKAVGQPGPGRNLRDAHSRYTAYAAVQRKDPALAKRAWEEFLGAGGRGGGATRQPRRVSGDSVLKPVDVMNVGTNGAAQWGLSAIENLALIGDVLDKGL